jgi:hypothetical protein
MQEDREVLADGFVAQRQQLLCGRPSSASRTAPPTT